MSSITTERPSYSPFAAWRDEKARAVLIQIVVLCAVVLVVGWLARNAIESIATQQIATGFEFLDHTAGFGIAQTLIGYTEESTYARALIVGLLNTLLVSALGIVLATLVGFVVGVARLSKNWLIAKLAAVYVEMLRNVPLLLWIFFFYYAVLRTLPLPENSFGIGNVVFLNQRGLYVPHLIAHAGAWWALAAFIVGVIAAFVLRVYLRRRHVETGRHFGAFWPGIGLIFGLPLITLAAAGFPVTLSFPELHGFNFSGGLLILPELLALTLALALYESTYIAEIVRAGIMGVPRGQVEAARALGLKPRFILRLVVLPQALRIIVPPLTSTYLSLTKNSSLAVAIAYPDLVSVFAGTILNQTGQAVEVLVITMGVYLALSLATSAFMNWYNSKQALKGVA